MKVYTSIISQSLVRSTNNKTYKIISYNDGSIIIQIKLNNKIYYHTVTFEDWFEKLVYFEILNDSPLWRYKIYDKNNNDVDIPRNSGIYCHYDPFCIGIDIFIETELIETYFDKSIALNILISNLYKKMPDYIKFDDTKSYYPNCNIYEPPIDFKIKLYDYQKKSLQKMINIENQLIDNNVEYTVNVKLDDIHVKFNPIKNLKSDISKNFIITTKGGILADEMGLGKTITTLSLITSKPSINNAKMIYSKNNEYWKIASKATLIICPSHIAKQWENEAIKSNPKLKIQSILSRKDHEKIIYKDIINADIIITSHQFLMSFKYYPCLHYRRITPASYIAKNRNIALKEYFTRNIINSNEIDDDVYEILCQHDLPLFEFFSFHRMIIDEGHEIFGEMLTNHSLASYMSSWLSEIDSQYNWYISGSPFINIKGLLNCMKFLNLTLTDPSLDLSFDCETLKELKLKKFNNIIEKKYLWENILSQICIRHKKSDVSNIIEFLGYEEKIEWITFTELESNLYKSKEYKISMEGLQQLCCHPLILDSCRQIFKGVEVDLSVMESKLIEHHENVIKVTTIKIQKLDPTNQAYHMLKKSYETTLNESKYLLSILNKLNNTELQEDLDNNCSICLDIITDGSLTKCGHIFCNGCIKTCLQYKSICPMCKKSLTNTEIFVINKKPVTVSENNPLIEKYGSKLGKLIMMIRNIVIEPDSRIIVFSQWDFMLLLIGKTLSENGIANCFVKGNVWARNSAINKFKNGKTLSGEDNKVIMLSLKNSASGTNLIEASHIFFVEPINGFINEIRSIEAQAIGRACRIGQTKKIQVYRILVKDTIEENIYNNIYCKNE